jgi:hypothetical protein
MKKDKKEKKVIELDLLNTETSGAIELALVESPAIESLWMAFKEVKLVKPKAGETEQEFVSRCIGVLVGDEGYEQDQAAAICYSTFEEKMAEVELYYEGEDVFRLSEDEFDLAIEPNPCWEGYEPYGLKDDGTPNCIPVKAKELKLAESYTDYPEGAVANAKRALEWADKNGWGDCGMGPGKARANQLANREPISEDTIARMSAFERHRQNSETPYSEGCGKLMWDAWGGDAGIRWAKNKLEEIRKVELSYDTSALPVYVDEIGKPISKAVKMSMIEDERIIVGPVIIPNKEIPRVDEADKSVYYIKYSPETVKKMAEKFIREKRTDATNIEHNPEDKAKTYIFESWIVENLQDKANTVYNLDVPVGTWVVKARVTDDEVWAKVKSGELKGWSLEGSFVDKEELDQLNRDKALYQKIVDMLKAID